MARYIIGVDEVGRGSLAGPVVVAAVAAPKNLEYRIKNLGKLRDSKRLTRKQRERWFKYAKEHPGIRYVVARVYPRLIDKINIARAANLAALRAFQRLTKTYNLKPTTCLIYLDGGLYLGSSKWQRANKILWGSARTVTKGDEKYSAIKIASIIAKVSRDRHMVRLHKRHPRYGFHIHKGYGTRTHFAAIRRHGPSEFHRTTFL